MIDYQVQIDAITMGPGTSYVIHSIDGFGLPDVRATDTPRPRDHGEFYGLDYLPGRTITLQITILGTSPSDTVAKLDALMDVWSPDTFPTDTASFLPLRFQFPGQSPRLFRGRPRRAQADTSRIVGNRVPVTLEYKTADPRQYAEVTTSQSIGLFVASGGRTYPRVYPLSFGGGASALLTLTNSGNFPSRPTAHIDGPVTNPKIENIDLGKFLKFSISLASTDYLDIDFDARTVVLNGTASRYGTITSDSQWWDLPPGNSTIRFSADSYDPAALLTLVTTSAWL